MHYFSEKHKNDSQQDGFTLVEVLVSMSIFTVVVGMAVGTMMVLIDANAKSQNVQQAVSNVSFALDSMSREIRTGTSYYGANNGDPSHVADSGTRDCANCNSMSFIEASDSLTGSCEPGGGRIAYRHNNEAIERRLCNGSWEPITAPNVLIDEFRITVRHTDRTDDLSPLVTMFVQARVEGITGVSGDFWLQSSITQQALDI